MKYYFLILLIVGNLCASCSTSEKSETALGYFVGHSDPPSDLNSALPYIENLDEVNRLEAYQQLIVGNPAVYEWDVDFEKYSSFPSCYSPNDKSFRIYSFDLCMHDDYQILQHKNSKGKVITSVLTPEPLM